MSIRSINGRVVRLTASPKTIHDFKRVIEIGEVLRGRIVELFEENKALVSFKGYNLVAETKIVFKKGDIFFAQVRAKEPKIIVRLIPYIHHHGFSDQDAIEIIRHLGKRKTDELIKIIRELVRHRAPIRRELVEEIQRYLPLFDDKVDEGVKTLLFMRFNSIRITQRNLGLIRAHLFERADIARVLNDLLDAMMNVDLEGKGRIIGLIKELFIDLDHNPYDGIKSFFQRIGFGYEGMLQGDLAHGRGFREEVFRGRDLKFELLRLLAILRGMEGVESLKEAIERALDHLLSMQLASTSKGEDGYLYIQIPIYPWGGEPRFVELKIYYDKKNPLRINPERLRLHISLKTTNLGLVEVELILYHGSLDITFRMEDEKKRSFIRSRFPSLSQGLEALGYRVTHISSIVASTKDEVGEDIGVWSLGKVDLRV